MGRCTLRRYSEHDDWDDSPTPRRRRGQAATHPARRARWNDLPRERDEVRVGRPRGGGLVHVGGDGPLGGRDGKPVHPDGCSKPNRTLGSPTSRCPALRACGRPVPPFPPFPPVGPKGFLVNARRLLSLLAVFLAGAAGVPRLAHSQQADVIRGRVIGPDSLPVPEVLVTVTSFSGNVSRTARTNRDGRFTVTFPAGDGDYMVAFAAIGYAAKRFEVKRMADEEILVADAKLTKVDAVLGNVNITAPRDKVARNDPAPDISGTERPIPTADVPVNLMGDLAAMAATLPGVQTVPGEGGDPNGFSVLGLGADQNNTTLNGMNFGGSGLPRDAAVSSGLVTTPYDVSRGGFSGAQMSIRTRRGSNFITRGMSLNFDGPRLQWTDPVAQSLVQEYTNASLGGTVSG